MRYASDPIYLSLNDRQPAIGPNGPELFPAAGPAVAGLIQSIFHSYASDAGIVVDDGPQLRCGRYSELGAEIKWAPESAHLLLPQSIITLVASQDMAVSSLAASSTPTSANGWESVAATRQR